MKRLKLTYNSRSIVSGAFDFRAFRLISDALKGELTQGKLDGAMMQGLISMFDGTELTADIFESRRNILDQDEVAAALNAVSGWYFSVKHPEHVKIVGELPENPILSLYQSMIERHLPSELDKQDPQLLLDVIHTKKSDTTPASEIPDSVKDYYGL